MNLNWKAFIVAFVVTLAINSSLTLSRISSDALIMVIGPIIGGLVAGYMTRSYKKGVLYGGFSASAAITVIFLASYSSIMDEVAFGGILSTLMVLVFLVGIISIFFVLGMTGSIIGVTIKRVKNRGAEDYHDSNNVLMDKDILGSTYAEKQVSKPKYDSWGLLSTFIVIVISIMACFTVYLFWILVRYADQY